MGKYPLIPYSENPVILPKYNIGDKVEIFPGSQYLYSHHKQYGHCYEIVCIDLVFHMYWWIRVVDQFRTHMPFRVHFTHIQLMKGSELDG